MGRLLAGVSVAPLLPVIIHTVNSLVIYKCRGYIETMDGMPKDPRGRKPHAPTDAERQIVQLHATMGTTQEMIARVLKIDPKTLRLHYRDELDLAMVQANAAIGGVLFKKAKAGDTASAIFWMKTRGGWREKSDLNLVSTDRSMSPVPGIDVTRLSSAALMEIAGLGDAPDDT
jgi:hypothetical protein